MTHFTVATISPIYTLFIGIFKSNLVFVQLCNINLQIKPEIRKIDKVHKEHTTQWATTFSKTTVKTSEQCTWELFSCLYH